MFLDNKYTKWYFNIVNNGKNRILNNYTETHHIIPKSLGGNNEKENLVVLTAKEHYVTHLLLMKMCIHKKDKQKMCAAWLYLSKVRNDYTRQRYTSNLYEYHKITRAKILSEQMSGDGNPMYGKKHTEETKERIGKTNSRQTLTEDGRKRKSEFSKKNNPMHNPTHYLTCISNRKKKFWRITDPKGNITLTDNLTVFCKENNLHTGNMSLVASGKLNHHKKWQCTLLINNNI